MVADSVRWRSRQVTRRQTALFLAAPFVFASLVYADSPATRPSHDGSSFLGRDSGAGRDNPGHDGASLGGRPMGPLDHRFDPTPEAVNAALDFWQSNSPNRMSLFKLLPEEAQRRRKFEMTRRYQTIQVYKESNPDLFDLLVNQVKLRDDAFQLAKDGKIALLHDKASQIVDVTLKSREIRMALLEQELAKQKEELATDSSDPTKLVDEESSRAKLDAERLSHTIERIRSHDRTGRADVAPDSIADSITGAGSIADADPMVFEADRN